MVKATIPRLLWITDRTQCGGRTLALVAQQFLAGVRSAGVPAGVMLREKDLAGGELYGHAQALRMVTREYDAMFLVNGRIDVAVATEADGVHLPQNGLPPAVARTLLGDRLLGVSCHTKQEVDAAVGAGADYVTFGPVYDTPSKRQYGPPAGLEALAATCAACPVPVMGLGGIDLTTGAAVLDAGARGLAFISVVATADEPAAAAAGFAALCTHGAAR